MPSAKCALPSHASATPSNAFSRAHKARFPMLEAPYITHPSIVQSNLTVAIGNKNILNVYNEPLPITLPRASLRAFPMLCAAQALRTHTRASRAFPRFTPADERHPLHQPLDPCCTCFPFRVERTCYYKHSSLGKQDPTHNSVYHHLNSCFYIGFYPPSWQAFLQAAKVEMHLQAVLSHPIPEHGDALQLAQEVLDAELWRYHEKKIKMDRVQSTNVPNVHIDIRYHFIHEWIEKGIFLPQWLPSHKNMADVLTKALPRPLFVKHVANLRLLSR
ncbi:hypothetical protein EV424DRAFT_1534154 [Suillus variegatus]|nr:hypothetical protein EV424DRAFT_1534154 [Suillus variegatus]